MPIGLWRERIAGALQWAGGAQRETGGANSDIGVILRRAGSPTTVNLTPTLESLICPGRLTKVFVDGLPIVKPCEGLEFVDRLEDLPCGPSDWLLFLTAGDVLTGPLNSLFDGALLSTDVLTFDLVYQEDDFAFPLFAPGANPTLARAVDYVWGRLAVRPSLMAAALEREKCSGSLVLRHWLRATSTSDAEDRWHHQFQVAIEIQPPLPSAILADLEVPVRTENTTAGGRVSVVICTKDKGLLLHQLLRSLEQNCWDLLADIVVVANDSTNPFALAEFDRIREKQKYILLYDKSPFNFSRLSNAGARRASGEHLLFLNDDICPVTDDWLATLLETFNRDPEVGITGPLLVYPDERVQHAGMYLGYRGTAGHTLRYALLPQAGYLYYTSAPRQVSAITGAAMLVSRVCFEALNGFDERLATFLQDVDLCLRARRSGYAIVFEPRAILIHMESASIRPVVNGPEMSEQRERESAYFHARWSAADLIDSLHNSAFSTEDETLRSVSLTR